MPVTEIKSVAQLTQRFSLHGGNSTQAANRRRNVCERINTIPATILIIRNETCADHHCWALQDACYWHLADQLDESL